MAQFVHDGILYEELPNGKARVVGPAGGTPQGGGQVFTMPNPKAQYEAPQAAATVKKTEQDIRIAAEKADRDRREWNASHFPDGTPKPQAAKPASADPDRVPQIRSALENIKRIRELSQKSLAVGGYSQGAKNLPLIGPWLGQNRANVEGALQMVQGDLIQQQIARLSQMNGGKGVASIANSETEAQRMASSIANLDPNQDLNEFLHGLDRAEQFYRRQFATLHGAKLDDPKERQRYGISMDGSSPPAAPAIEGGSGPKGPDMGLATGAQKFAPDEAASKLATELVRNGLGDEQVNASLQAAGFSPLQQNSIASVRAYLKQNPAFKGVVPGVGKFEDTNFFNRAAASPAGAFAGSYLDGATAGGVSALVGQEGRDKLQALEAENPKSAFAGGAVGGLSATIGAGKLLGATRLAPWLAQNAGKAALAGDAAYGGAYGFNTADEGQGLDGAGIGTLAGLAGHGLGSGAAQVAGRFTRGVVDPSVQYLKGRGVDLTGGQMLGGFVKSAEDKLMSVPGLGGMIGRRRREGLNQFDRAAFNDAGAPIGFAANQTGSAGVDDLLGTPGAQGATGRAYDAATAGVTAPLDTQFSTDYAAARARSAGLPADLSTKFNLALDNRVDPAISGGNLTGDSYQQAVRGLKGYKAEASKPGFESDYRDALSAAQDALTGNMMRNGGPGVVTGLQAADQSYKLAKVLQDAVKRARNGSRSGEAEVFTPSQLIDAGEANRFSGSGTSRPFYQLGKAGQEVLPSQVPDSGTAGRHFAGLLAAGGLGAGLDYATPGDGAGATGAGLGSLGVMAALNSKAGRTALEKILLDRPDIARRLGSGLVGNSSYAGALGRGAAVTAPGILGY